MNPKQAVPLIATLAPLAPAIAPIIPVLLIGGVAILALNWLLSNDDKQKQPEAAPANAQAENQRKAAETAVFRQIPAEIPIKSVSILVSAPPSPPIKKKFVTRKDLATAFNHGTRSLTRTAAVTALKRLGFGRTAAYAALTPDGRFAAWLQFAPDGIITWTDRHGT